MSTGNLHFHANEEVHMARIIDKRFRVRSVCIYGCYAAIYKFCFETYRCQMWRVDWVDRLERQVDQVEWPVDPLPLDRAHQGRDPQEEQDIYIS